ncbi:methyl-accepting chemotaxis protein [Acidovorax sp. DW039]|uniref:methyl-accepting chemotaxis protein n=1 Tax=Acidovorax sp. DW039 TaxID=3095606 RepID=UPI00308E59A7|nr:methyl-accepting chemotaxis protein [Acidovorax sp. DW039]
MNGWIAHLKLWQKFALVCVASLLLAGMSSVLVLQDRYQDLHTARLEQSGLKPADDVLKLIQLSQQHRGLSNGALSGNADFIAQREKKQVEVQTAFAQALRSVQALAATTGSGKLVPLAQKIEGDWSALTRLVTTPGTKAAESFKAHTAMITAQLGLLYQVLDASTLTLDPEAASYYLMSGTLDQLPGLTESLGQARGLGAAALTRRELTAADRAAVQTVATTARLQAEKAQALLQRAAEADSAVTQTLGSLQKKAADDAARAIQTMEQQLLTPTELTHSPKEYFAALTEAIDSQFALITKGQELLNTMLNDRVSQAWQFMAYFAILLTGAIVLSIWVCVATVRQAQQAVHETLDAARALAAGDLGFYRGKQTRHAQDEFGQIAQALQESTRSLAQTVQGIQQSIASVNTAATEIASGTHDLSARTEQQASALEQTAASMETLNQTVNTNSQSASQAHALARQASAEAQQGGEQVQKLAQLMQGIHESSRKISEITSVIDSIAFQTNILALNAAVEAARAGEQGRGFAVVASEVRSLAQRSAQAAHEIKALITDSVQRVDEGSRQATHAGQAVEGLVQGIQRVSGIMAEISAASAEQASGITQVLEAVEHMDRMTQQNAALVEQTAAASQGLRSQADQVSLAMGRFQLK